jgi:hypothetical protein
MKNTMRHLFAALAIIFGSISLYVLLVANQALTPELYTDALEEAGVYQEISNVIEERVTEGLIESGHDIIDEIVEENIEETPYSKALVWALNSLLDSQTGTVVEAISDRIGLEQGIQNAFEKDIEFATGWLRGDAELPKFFSYVPSVEAVEEIEENGAFGTMIMAFTEDILGVTELPECSYSGAETSTLEALSEGNWEGVTCTSDTVRPVIAATVEEFIPPETIENLEDELSKFLETYKLKEVWDWILGSVKDLATFKEAMYDAQGAVMWLHTTGVVVLSLSIVSGLIAIVMSQGTRLKMFISLAVIPGVVLLLGALVFNLFIADSIVDSLNFGGLLISSDKISATQSALLEASFMSSAGMILHGLHDQVIRVGVLLVGPGFVAWLLGVFVARGGWEWLKSVFGSVRGWFVGVYEGFEESLKHSEK